MPRWPRGLVRALRAGHVVPFAGAGVSMAVQRLDRQGQPERLFPSWKELLEKAAAQLCDENRLPEAALVRALLGVKPPRFLQAAEEARSGLKGAWSRLMRSEFGPGDDGVVQESRDLARAVWALANSVVITTNYDNVLQWTCPDPENLQRCVIEAATLQTEILLGDVSRPTIWYLHGHVDEVEDLIITPGGYSDLYDADRDGQPRYAAALQTLRACLAARVFLFIGFSMHDEHFSAQLVLLNRMFKGAMGPHFMLVQESELDAFRSRLANLPLQLIPVEDFGLPMVRALQELAQEKRVTHRPPGKQCRLAIVLSGDLAYTMDILFGFRMELDRALAEDAPRGFELVVRVAPREGPGTSAQVDAQWAEIAQFLRDRSRGREFDYCVGIGTQASMMLYAQLKDGLRRGAKERLIFLGVTDPVAAGLVNSVARRNEEWNVAGVGYGDAPEALAAQVNALFPQLPLIFVYNKHFPQDLTVAQRLSVHRLVREGRLRLLEVDGYPNAQDLSDSEAVYFSWYTLESMLERGESLTVFANRRLVATTVQNVRENQLALAAVTVDDQEIGKLGARILIDHEIRRKPLGHVEVPAPSYRYWLNLTTASTLRVTFSDEIKLNAAAIF